MQLSQKKTAVLVANGFEQVEPVTALREAGATLHIVSPEAEQVKGWNHTDWGDTFSVDVPLEQANAYDYDGLLLLGGQMNPNFLRANEKALNFTHDFFTAHKPVAASCHGP